MSTRTHGTPCCDAHKGESPGKGAFTTRVAGAPLTTSAPAPSGHDTNISGCTAGSISWAATLRSHRVPAHKTQQQGRRGSGEHGEGGSVAAARHEQQLQVPPTTIERLVRLPYLCQLARTSPFGGADDAGAAFAALDTAVFVLRKSSSVDGGDE